MNISTPTPWSNRTTESVVFSTPVHILGQPLYLSWITLTSTWRQAWTLHVVSFCLLFSFEAMYSVIGVIRSQKRKEKVTRNLSYVVHSLVGVLGLTRLLTLSVFHSQITAASARDRISVLSRIVFGLGFPCITAAFALVQISFTEALKGKLSESKLGNFTFIAVVISFQFLIVLVVETLTTVLRNVSVLFFATKLYFLIMAAVTMASILYSGGRVLCQAVQRQRALSDISQHYGSTASSQERRESNAQMDMNRSLRKVKIILLLTSIFCTLICAMEIYSIVELAGLLAGKDGALAPWPWYIYQTLFRLAELGMAATILFTMSPSNQSSDNDASTTSADKIADNKKRKDVHPMLNRAYNMSEEDFNR